MDNVPHLAWPIRIDGVTPVYATNQQDTNDEVAACVAVIVGYERGTRDDDLEFGIRDPTFETRPLDIADIESAVEDYESRASVSVTERAYDPADPGAARVTVSVSVLQTEDM